MKPKTQRLPKKKQQEEAIKQAQLKSKIKPQPAPERPKVVAKTTAPMKKRMKPIRGPMVEAKPTAGRMTAADMFEKRKKDKNKAMIRKMKPLRIQ